MLVPRVALTATTDVATITTPATSLLVYNTATAGDVTPGYYYFDGTIWQRMVSGTIVGTDDQNITGSGLAGTTLTIGIEGGTNETVDLSSLQDGTGTDSQTLSLSGSTLSISGGNNVTLTDNVNDADADATNELQTISKTGTTVTLSNGGGSFTDVDTDTQLTEAQVDAFAANNGYLTSFTEVDGSVTNEIQSLSISGSTVSLSNGGGSVTVPSSADGDAWAVTGEDVASAVGRTGDVGIGTAAPSAKLDVVGTFQLVDGTEGVDRVLTSDANGNARWKPAATSANIHSTSNTFPSSVPTPVSGYYDMTTFNITIAGIYKIHYDITCPVGYILNIDNVGVWSILRTTGGRHFGDAAVFLSSGSHTFRIYNDAGISGTMGPYFNMSVNGPIN